MSNPIDLTLPYRNSARRPGRNIPGWEEKIMNEPTVTISMELAKALIDDCRELAEATQSTSCRKAYYDQVVQLEVAVQLANRGRHD